MDYLHRPRVRLKDPIGGFRTDWSGPIRENIRDIKEAQLNLNNLVQRYNYRIDHSTTGEIPYIRFQRAIREKRTLFRKFTISPSFKSTKDIFCLKVDKIVDSYRKISINNLE